MICRYKIKFISDIEQKIRKLLVNIAVAPFVGVWIEISCIFNVFQNRNVAPFVGVWIEIVNPILCVHVTPVAPFVGVWIEITNTRYPIWDAESLPSWECGLKSIGTVALNTPSSRSLRGSVD